MQNQPSGPVVLVITESPTVLVVEKREKGTSRALKYERDGSETITLFGADKATGRMRVEAGKIVTETLFVLSGVPLRQSQTFSLSADGHEMNVETSLDVVHGYEGRADTLLAKTPNYSDGKDVYLRQ